MGVEPENVSIKRIQYFSDPGTNYSGAPIGTSHTHHNTRQILNYAPTAAAFMTKNSPMIDTPSLNLSSDFCNGMNSIFWTQEWGPGSVSYKVYRSDSADMSFKTLHYNGPALSSVVDIANANDRPYIAVEACDSNGFSLLSSA